MNYIYTTGRLLPPLYLLSHFCAQGKSTLEAPKLLLQKGRKSFLSHFVRDDILYTWNFHPVLLEEPAILWQQINPLKEGWEEIEMKGVHICWHIFSPKNWFFSFLSTLPHSHICKLRGFHVVTCNWPFFEGAMKRGIWGECRWPCRSWMSRI